MLVGLVLEFGSFSCNMLRLAVFFMDLSVYLFQLCDFLGEIRIILRLIVCLRTDGCFFCFQFFATVIFVECIQITSS